MVKVPVPEGNEGRGGRGGATSAIRGSDEAEIVKFLKPPNLFSAAGYASLVPRRSRSNTLLSASSSLTADIYRWRISSREISRAISATDFYAAITSRFSFLSSPCASSCTPIPISISSLAEEEGELSPYGKSVTSSVLPPRRTCRVILRLIRERQRT